MIWQSRVLPAHLNTRPPTETEYIHYLTLNYLTAQGLAQEADFGHLIKGVKPAIKQTIKHLIAEGQLCEVKVQQQTWLATPDKLSQLNQSLQSNLKILRRLDNLVIQRERMRKLFNFDYQLWMLCARSKTEIWLFCTTHFMEKWISSTHGLQGRTQAKTFGDPFASLWT